MEPANQYPIKAEIDQNMDSVTGGGGGSPYHPILGVAQSHVYAAWNSQPQIQQSPISEYPYSYGTSTSYATPTQYADAAMYPPQPQPSPTTDSSLHPSAGNPVPVSVSLSVPLNSLGYGFTNPPSTASNQLQQQQQTQAPHQQPISRPPSVVHSPMNPSMNHTSSMNHSEAAAAFASSRARSTSYSGPYYLQPSMHPNMFSSIPPPCSMSNSSMSGFGHPMARMSMTSTVTGETNNQVHMGKHVGGNYYGVNSGNVNGMTSPMSLDASSSSASTTYDYIQEDQSPTNSMGTSNQYRAVTPGPGQQQQGMYGYITPAPPQQQQQQHPTSVQQQLHQQQQQQHHQSKTHHQHSNQNQGNMSHQPLPPPIPPLASSVATGGAPIIPRSMSMGNIPGSTVSPNPPWYGGRNTPSGILTPNSTLTPGSTMSNLSMTPSALSRSTASRLGIALTIPSNYLHEHRTPEYEMYPGSASGTVSPVVLSSLIRGSSGVGGIGGGGSGPGTASNGGSVPLTPTTDETAPFDYHHFSTGAGHGFTRGTTGSGYGDTGDDDDDDEEDEDEKMTMPPLHMGGVNGSPRRGVGVTRTSKKRRSTTIAAGPSAAAAAAVGTTRSRSGTMVNGSSASAAAAAAVQALTMSPVDMHGAVSASMGLGMLVNSQASSPVNGNSGSTILGVNGSAGSVGVGGQANSPLAMKELSPAHKPMIETYLNRYLNYLCVNPNAKDRMGHQIHQMYTARRIQRYEQLYGWRPLKFRIEAFVNGFVDLLTASGLSQDVTMKIPHYLNNSRLFSRFNESGNRMKSQGQTIWRVRARCRNDIPGADAPPNGTFHHHSPSVFSQQQQQQIHHHQQQAHHQQIQQQQQQVHQQQSQMHQHDVGSTNGLMMASDPLLWEFLPYERSIVGQPPLAIVGTAWQWNMKVHDHWTPRKKVSWSFSSNATSSDTGTGSAFDGSDSSSPLSASSSSSNTLPRWLSLQGSKLKGTPTESGVYPISIEATFQEDNDPEPVVVRGNYTIQVSKAIGGWKTKVAVPHDGVIDSPEGDHVGGSGDMGYGNESGVGRGLGRGNVGSGDGTDDVFPSLIGERMGQLTGMYDANQGSTRGFPGMSYTYGYVH